MNFKHEGESNLSVMCSNVKFPTVKGMVTGDYGGDSGYAEKKCYPTYETKYRKQCEDYTEKVCRTTHNEQCQDVA